MPKRKAESEPKVEVKKEEAIESTKQQLDSSKIELSIERSNHCPLYRTGAQRIEDKLKEVYPNIVVKQNPDGKPRKGSFEVSMNGIVLYSKLDIFGPAKSKQHIPTPDQILEMVEEQSKSEKPSKKAKTK